MEGALIVLGIWETLQLCLILPASGSLACHDRGNPCNTICEINGGKNKIFYIEPFIVEDIGLIFSDGWSVGHPHCALVERVSSEVQTIHVHTALHQQTITKIK